jgi:hypothetical protein
MNLFVWNIAKLCIALFVTIGFKISALHIRCCKGFIVYHKANGISAMKKRVEQKYVDLL